MINSGDTAWVLLSAALVLLMTPGVAFFYSGLVSARNVINTMNMCFICCAIVPVVWAIGGYSLAFSEGSPYIGGLQALNLEGLSKAVSGTVPQYAFVLFQMMFAVITPALIAGAVVGRMKFKAFVFFVVLWSILVYSPIAHWVWGPGGWLLGIGALDFAGGTVVHLNAGCAALVAAIILGPRQSKKQHVKDVPHSVPFVILGASLLWFGWYGFNAGSALAANELAGVAFLTTTLATAASILTWTILSWFRTHSSTGVGKASAAVIGLVAITPAAGFVTPLGSMAIGAIASAVCYFLIINRERIFSRIDDTLDVFICHGVGGLMGAILTGVFASKAVNAAGADGLLYGDASLMMKQLIAVGASAGTSIVGTAVILLVLKMVMNIRPTQEEEMIGIDKAEHDEAAYK